MEYRDVKLRIELETSGAVSGLDSISAPRPDNPGGPALPGQPAPDAGAGAGRGQEPAVAPGAPEPSPTSTERARSAQATTRARDEEETERRIEARVLARVGDTARAAASGRLSSHAEGILAGFAAAIPGGGGAVRTALLAERYGPAVAAGIEQLVPEPLRPVGRAVQQATEGAARVLATGRSYLDAGGAAAEYAAELAGGEQRLARRVDSAFVARAAFARYSVEVQVQEAERFRRIYNMEAAGGAAGAVVQDVVARLAAGLGFSVGR